MDSGEPSSSSPSYEDFPLDEFVRGVEIYYSVVCPTKLWLFMKGLGREHESSLVILGRLLHERFFKRRVKNVLVEEKASIDFLSYGDKIVIHEVKHSDKLSHADRLQIMYYILVLLNKGVNKVYGVIHYPRQRRRERVRLTKEGYREIMERIRFIEELRNSDEMPPPEWKPICRRCSYHEFCWLEGR